LNHILTISSKNLYRLYFLYIFDINNRAYYRLWNLVNDSLSLPLGFKVAYCAPWRWYTCTKTCQNNVFSVLIYLILCIFFGAINWVHWCYIRFIWYTLRELWNYYTETNLLSYLNVCNLYVHNKLTVLLMWHNTHKTAIYRNLPKYSFMGDRKNLTDS